MSFMIKIALALPLTLAAVAAHGASASTPAATPVEQAAETPDRPSCDVCAEIYDNCISEGITPAGCQRLAANCYRNCL